MSLTSMIKGKTEKDIEFQNILKNIINPRPLFTTVSSKKAFSSEYEELAPYSLSNPYYSTIVGMAFDYISRFIIAKKLKDKNIKKLAYSNLVAEHGLKKMEKITEKKLYKILDKKYEQGKKVCERFINKEKINFDEILYFSGYLASLESIARSGLPPLDINKSLIEDIDIEIINDLRILSNVFQNNFMNSEIINEDSNVIFNPKFSIGSICCGGADADVLIDGTLYDFKCTKSRTYSWIECAQLVGYYLLSIINIRCGETDDEQIINNLAFYRSRYGEIEKFNVTLLDENKVEQAIEELGKLWGLEFSM